MGVKCMTMFDKSIDSKKNIECQNKSVDGLNNASIKDVYSFVGYPPTDFHPVFETESIFERLSFSYDTSALIIDSENYTVKALKEGVYKVNATVKDFSFTFNVNAIDVDKNAKKPDGDLKYNCSPFAPITEDRILQWKQKGNANKTTVFIGDSYFDTAFWSNFYTESYPSKDALALGICSTTSYDWEQWAMTWLADISPKNIVMHMGTNNVYDDGDDVEEAIMALQRMFVLIHSSHPHTKIYWFGITQRGYDAEKQEIVGKVNSAMKEWCDDREYITYIDTPSIITRDMLKDDVHPHPSEYYVFVDELSKTDIEILNTSL